MITYLTIAALASLIPRAGAWNIVIGLIWPIVLAVLVVAAFDEELR